MKTASICAPLLQPHMLRMLLTNWACGQLTPLDFFKKIIFIYLFIYLLAAPSGMWDLSSPTRVRTLTPYSGGTGSAAS